ncbi:MAG: M15 family metallopeptidase [Oscillospiraceae bacterium]|nr:M15 family metallopeptidase [Oscillospiraceae bacterium]
MRYRERRKGGAVHLFITVLCMLVIGGVVLYAMRGGDDIPEPEPAPPAEEPAPPVSSSPPVKIEITPPPVDKPPDNNDDTDCPFYEAQMPILANRENPIPGDYDPELASIGNGFLLNYKAAYAWEHMQEAARADGISLWAISAYRSNESQTRNFNNRVAEHIAAGRTPEAAHAMTAEWIAIPGTSEHELGLAIDINSLSEAFENTPEFAWLSENSADFGFILRYPKGLEGITSINYEPWHYRYVGSNHAKRIVEMGIVLDEYVISD